MQSQAQKISPESYSESYFVRPDKKQPTRRLAITPLMTGALTLIVTLAMAIVALLLGMGWDRITLPFN
jgi:hypothetical protein